MTKQEYLDEYGMIINLPSKDGGDSAQRQMSYYFLCSLLNKAEPLEAIASDFRKLECPGKPNHYRRHPDPSMWYSDCDRLSRDQATPLVIAMGYFGFKKRLFWFMLHHIKRLGFLTNTRHNGVWKDEREHNKRAPNWKPWDFSWKFPDFCGPEFWALYIRGFRIWLLFPFLFILDIETLIGTWIRNKKEDKDVLNHILVCLYSNERMPTPISRLALRLLDKDKMARHLREYFNGKDPRWLGELYIEALETQCSAN